MKESLTSSIPALTALLLVASDSSSPEITFESAFPTPHQDLMPVLGGEFPVRQDPDTLRYRLSTGQASALTMVLPGGDTLFWAKTARFRGVYYFNQARKEGSYYRYAVKIQDNLIDGLNRRQQQNDLMTRQIRKGGPKNLITYLSPDSSQIRLQANKKELKNLFATVLPQLTPDTLVHTHTGRAGACLHTNLPARPAAKKASCLFRAYPNPAQDFVNLGLHKSHRINYQLTGLKGKTVVGGAGQGELLHIDLHQLQAGIYALNLTLTDHQRREQESLLIKQ